MQTGVEILTVAHKNIENFVVELRTESLELNKKYITALIVEHLRVGSWQHEMQPRHELKFNYHVDWKFWYNLGGGKLFHHEDGYSGGQAQKYS